MKKITFLLVALLAAGCLFPAARSMRGLVTAVDDYSVTVVKECDAILVKLAQSDLTTNEGVCYTLIARYFKRVAAHLVNISTSVVLPISQLDYFDEKKAEKSDD